MQQAFQHPVETKTPPHHFMIADAILLRQYVSTSSKLLFAQVLAICNRKDDGLLGKGRNLKPTARVWMILVDRGGRRRRGSRRHRQSRYGCRCPAYRTFLLQLG